MEDLKPREMEALKIAEEDRIEGIWAYKLMQNGWSLSTAHDTIQVLTKLGFLQPQDQTKRRKKPYLLAPGFQIVTSKTKTVGLLIKSVNTQDASHLHFVNFVMKAVAQCAGTALCYVGSATS